MTQSSSPSSLELPIRYYCWYPPHDHIGYREETIILNRKSVALLLVDVYLPDKYNPDGLDEDQSGSLSEKDYGLWRRKIEDGVVPALNAVRKAGLPVIYVCNQNFGISPQNSQYGKKLKRSLGLNIERSFQNLLKESQYSEGHIGNLNFIDAVAPLPGDYFIGKTVYSGFFNTPLDSLLRNLGIDTLITAGFRLDACLLGTVLDAFYRNYRVILIRDATLASELPHEIDRMAFTERMILHFEALIGETISVKDLEVATGSYH